MKARVTWLFRRDRAAWLAAFRRGEQPCDFFYGFTGLADRYETAYVEGADGRLPLQYALLPLEKYLSRRMGIGFGLHIVLTHLAALRRADVLVSTVDTCGLPLALLKRRGLLSGKIVYLSQGLSDRIDAYGRDRRLARFYRGLLREVDALAALSDGAQASLASWLGIAPERIHVLRFGVDADFWHNTGPSGDELLSVGSDPGRDYDTLMAAVGGLPLCVVTRSPLPAAPPTVRRGAAATSADLRDLYSGARFVVIPLKDISQPSGQSTALQAMACAKAVVLTQTRGYFGEERFVSWENCVLVPPGDVRALRDVLHRLAGDAALCARLGARARETVVRYFGADQTADGLARIIDGCLARTPAAAVGR